MGEHRIFIQGVVCLNLDGGVASISYLKLCLMVLKLIQKLCEISSRSSAHCIPISFQGEPVRWSFRRDMLKLALDHKQTSRQTTKGIPQLSINVWYSGTTI